MSLVQFGSAAAKIPSQGLMKMGDSGACLASVAHNVDKNIPDDTPICREHQENSTRRRAASTWFIGVSLRFWVLMMRSAALLAR